MEEPIRVETTMTYKDYAKFAWFNVLRKGKHLKPALIFLFTALAFAIACYAIVAAAEGLVIFIETSGLKLLFALLIAPAYFLLLYIMIKWTYKRRSNTLPTKQHFEFMSDRLKIESDGQGITGNTDVKYEILYRAFEMRDAFYLYINKLQAFPLQKRDIDSPTTEKLTALLKEKLGSKYVKCF